MHPSTDYAELRLKAEAATPTSEVEALWAFVGAANPATILTLLDTLEAQQERIAELEGLDAARQQHIAKLLRMNHELRKGLEPSHAPNA